MPTRRVLILANPTKPEAGTMALGIAERFKTLGVETSSAESSDPSSKLPELSDLALVVSLGGDGTVLHASRLAAPWGIPILPFNLGRLGFIAGFNKNEWRAAIDAWNEGRLNLSARLMLSILVSRDERPLATFLALNDGVVSGQGIAKVISLKLKAGGSSLGVYRSDGVIIATPTGSTAYNLAAGGPVLHPETESMVINPICPFTLSNRPLVVPGSERIELVVEEGRRTSVILTVDGQETFPLEPGDRVTFVKAQRKALICVPEKNAFYDILRSKLNWSGGSDA